MKKNAIAALVIAAMVLLSGCEKPGEQPFVSTVSKELAPAFYGSAASSVQLVIFSDFQCPACIRFEKEIEPKLIKQYADTGKIGITVKNYPLPMHKNAPRDAMAALCVLSTGMDAYKKFAPALYALEEQKAGLVTTDEDRLALALSQGVNEANFSLCMKEGWYVDSIKKDMKDGDRIKLPGTPSVYANGTLLDYGSEEQFFQLIDALLAKK